MREGRDVCGNMPREQQKKTDRMSSPGGGGRDMIHDNSTRAADHSLLGPCVKRDRHGEYSDRFGPNCSVQQHDDILHSAVEAVASWSTGAMIRAGIAHGRPMFVLPCMKEPRGGGFGLQETHTGAFPSRVGQAMIGLRAQASELSWPRKCSFCTPEP